MRRYRERHQAEVGSRVGVRLATLVEAQRPGRCRWRDHRDENNLLWSGIRELRRVRKV